MKQKISHLARKIRTSMHLFMQRKESKEGFIFLAFLLLATVFWFITSLNDNSTSTYQIPLAYTNIPTDAVILKELPTELTVVLKDKGSELFNYHFKGFKPIEVDFESYNQAGGLYTIPTSQLEASLREQLKSNTTTLRQYPDTINIFFTQQPGKKLPIVYTNEISTTPHYVIDGEPYFSTDSATLYAPKQLLDATTALYAEPTSLLNLSDTTTTEIAIRPIYGSKIVPSSVTLTVPVGELTLKKIEVPITVYNLTERYSIITFPPTTTITCMLPISKFSSLTPNTVKVGIDGSKLLSTPTKTRPIEVIKAPSYVSNIELYPQVVEYILEENNTTPKEIANL